MLALVDKGIFVNIFIPALLIFTSPRLIRFNVFFAMRTFDADDALVQNIEIQTKSDKDSEHTGNPRIKQKRQYKEKWDENKKRDCYVDWQSQLEPQPRR